MTRDTCRMPNCGSATGEQPDGTYRRSKFCSVACDVKFDHLKADARDARRDAEEPNATEVGDERY